MNKFILLCLFQVFFFSLPLLAQTVTADGTYDFSTLGRKNSGGNGFKKQKDKFVVSNIFLQDGTSIYADNNNQGTSQTLVIKAEGGTVNKTFTFKNLSLRNFSTDASLDVFTITLRNYYGAVIAVHSLASNQVVTTDQTSISAFNFTFPFPASGYALVSEIQLDFHFADATVAPSELTFDNITVADIKSTITLPLMLTEFVVRKEGAGVRINWKTAKEEGIDKLVLEHSADGIQFSAIGSFAGVPQSGSGSYTHYHATPAAGRNYYRLKEKNVSGEEKIYEVKFIDLAKGSLFISGSNPVVGPLMIKGLVPGMYDVSVTDLSGHILFQTKISGDAGGTYSFTLPPSVNRGTYMLAVRGNNEQASVKLVKQ